MDIGYGIAPDRDIVSEIMRVADSYREGLGVKIVSGFARQAIRQDVYDEVFLKVKPDPWSTVLMNERERYASTHLWYSRASEFLVNDVATKTGLNMKEFFKLPTFMVEYILTTLRQANSHAGKDAKTLQKELTKETDEFLNMKNRGGK